MPGPQKFKVEQATYRSNRRAWILGGLEGQYMAIRGKQFLGPFPRFSVAWDAGIKEFGSPDSLLVERIRRDDRPVLIASCRTEPTRR